MTIVRFLSRFSKSIKPQHSAKSSIFFLGRIFRVIGSNDEIKRRRGSFDDLSGKVN